jgi:hypothetical protein
MIKEDMNLRVRNKERGIAMLIVLFSLLLLSVVGLGMMYSTNMETSINGNYRDKQNAFYAALAGLQEARDRLNGNTQDHVTLPAGLPSTGAANVIYIVSDSSVVKPWDTSNTYFDTELCQENVLSLMPNPGAPCTTTASGTSWYTVYNDNASSTWKLTNPLDWKWTRITIKGNNMTPVPVNGNSSSTAQTCWNGVNEMSTPTGYSAGCQPVGPVSVVNLTNGGSGYTAAPTVLFTSVDGNGSGASVATVTTTAETTGFVNAINVTTGGVYTSSTPPTVTLIGGGGSGATATANMHVLADVVTGYVSAIALGTGGTGYTSAPTVVFNGGGGSGATATATIATSTSVTSITNFNAGTACYTSAPAVTISGGGGTGATATATLGSNSCIYSWTYTGGSPPSCSGSLNSGQGYNPNDTSPTTFVSPYTSGGFTGVVNTTTSHKTLLSSGCCTVNNPGYDTTNYAANFNTTLKLTGGGSSTDCNNFTVTVTVGKRVSGINLSNGGSGYTSAPTVSIAAGAGTGATTPTASATIGALGVTSITLTNGGTGYSSAPTISFSGGGGSGATATASVVTSNTQTWAVTSVDVGPTGANSGGSGYTSAPTVSFSGGNQTTPATATATISTRTTGTYTVTGFTGLVGGSGYTANPTVTIVPAAGDTTGHGATATAQISGGTKFGQVYLLTSYAQTKTGARSMLQMEVATPVLGFNPGGALTLDGPNPTIDAMPNSMNFFVAGGDANSCGETADKPRPAIDGYDDPNADPATHSVQTIIDSLPRPDHYTGSGPSPSVQNGYASLGETMKNPADLYSMLGSIKTTADAQGHSYTGPASSVALGSCPTGNIRDASCQTVVDYVEGDLTLGPSTGYGILAVTGSLRWSGDFSWKGLIFVVGDGSVSFAGGGNGEIDGSIFVSKIWDASCSGTTIPGHSNLCTSVQGPTFHWNGGGGNGIRYDHCWATDLINSVPMGPFTSGKLGKMVSFRILPF